MNVFHHFRDRVLAAVAELQAAGRLPAELDLARVVVEPPRDAAHGDLSSNVGMVLAKPARSNPRAIAEMVGAALAGGEGVAAIEIANPGFLNLRLTPAFWRERIRDVLRAGVAYGDSAMGQGRPVNVEYVSANPTGPMHIGHARGAVVGDALAALLEKAGFAVTREYYINDAGGQVDVLAASAHLRYREALGEEIGAIPEGLYPGDYLRAVGEQLAEIHGDRWLAAPTEEWLPAFRRHAIDAMMAMIREDLAALGVRHDIFTSERSLVESGAIERALEVLEARDLLYTGVLEAPKGKLPDDWEPRPQTLFRATRSGDDVDRPLRKSDGSWTYFAADIAYHFDKFRRGFATQIDVWGADHGGYVKRMQSAVAAVSDGQAALDVKICQLVNLLDGGEPVKMSKRAGTFVTLREVVDAVGRDVVRFIMLTRKNTETLDFDLARVREQSKDNPVFYVQYAHARAHSVLRHARETLAAADLSPAALAAVELGGISDSAELALVRLMAQWPRIVESAAEAHEPHRIAFFLYDLASTYHMLWNKGKDDASLRFLVREDENLTLARLALVQGFALVIASGLRVFGVEPVEEMRA
ncbi:arginyl-tRNA synthetase [Stella humosa]|uniref:Arginine--tRNA ligase n=1 Tax=Stella humosa TaxID=94 RepID=A0A3N1M9I3_9PROT|nr:arginine--tRNA ligase [Stella humosa]ROP99888.1 arginyl-tRNA synthetase [Stella humosa]BBK30882.1 arginine--tRNA ligase [Stella humosa]